MMTRDEFKQLTAHCMHLGQIFRECAFNFDVPVDQDADGVYHIWYKDGSVLHITLHTDGAIYFRFQSNRKEGAGKHYYEWECDAAWQIISMR